MAYVFVPTPSGTLKVRVHTANGKIAQVGESATGLHTITIGGFKSTGGIAEANFVLGKIVGGLANGTYDLGTAKKIYHKHVVEDKLVYVEVVVTPAEIESLFNGAYEVAGTQFEAEDIDALFDGTYRISSSNKFTEEDINQLW